MVAFTVPFAHTGYPNMHRSTPRCCHSSASPRRAAVSAPSAKRPRPTFHDYSPPLPPWLVARLSALSFEHPTPIQRAALSVALGAAPRDVVLHAQTGSGKTLAYLLPALAAVDPARAATQALVVVPTQELGMQVYKVLRRLVGAYAAEAPAADAVAAPAFPVLPMLDQADLRRQKLQLRQTAPRVVVGNPLRVLALLNAGRLRLDLLKVLVVDEFDACLHDTATTAALTTILSARGREPRQTILASATVPQQRHFLRQCARQKWTRPDVAHVTVSDGPVVPESIAHWYALCEQKKKLAALRSLIIRFNADMQDGARSLAIRAIVFVMPSRSVADIVDVLNESLEGTFDTPGAQPVVGISDDLPIVYRRDALNAFRDGSARVLIATDVAARGLDIPDVSHVFHFDLPSSTDSYLHRAGRAGRQGRQGSSVVLVAPGETFVIDRTSNALGIDFMRVGR